MAFEMPQKILFKHCDPAGIVFYPRYFEIINDAVEAFFFEVVGLPFEDMHGRGAGVPTADIHVAFRAPSRHGDHLAVALTVTRVGGASLGLSVTGSAEGETRFTGEIVLVHVGADGRAARWPDEARARLEAQRPALCEAS